MPSFDAKDKSRYATFARRTLILSGGMTAVFGALGARLFQLQILNGDLYLTKAEENRVSLRLLAPPRGRIFDRFGVTLASNRRNYRVLLIPEQARGNVEETFDMLAMVLPSIERNRARVLKEAAQNKPFMPIVVAENLSWEEFAKLNLDLPYLEGVQPDVGETRDYPFGEQVSHVLGYVSAVTLEDKEAEKETPDPLLDLPGFRTGKRGIEKALDTAIRGDAGASRVEVNAYGRVIRELARADGVPGEDVYLTIDQDVQTFAHQALGEESGGCAVMDVLTGDVLALVSTPGYDPNAFNFGVLPGQWKAWMEDDHKPLLNKVLSGTYPPGSTFKMITALAALENGAIDPDFSFVCTGQVKLGGHAFHCWRRGGHGRVDLHLGLKHSCDCFFYEVARRVGIDALQQTALKMGLGTATGIEIPGERSGFVPSREWKSATFREGWQHGETLIAGIGQGYLLVTPLQLCMMAARLAGGLKVSPRIVHARQSGMRARETAERLDFSEEALALVRGGMNAVMNEPGGTAYASRIPVPGMEMAGKTGTAQVRRISAQERASGVVRNEHLPWKLRDHALFVAFAPVEAPRYACSVVLEHGSSGSGAAAPKARDILRFAQERGSLTRPPAYPITAAADVSGRSVQ